MKAESSPAGSTPVTESIKPLEGTTTVDDKMTFEPERLSYVAARAIAASIVTKVRDQVGTDPIVIAGDAFLADLGNLSTAKMQLDMLADDFGRVAQSLRAASATSPASSIKPSLATLAIAPAVSAGLQGALGLVSLLRENVEFHGVTTKIDPRAFEIALAAQLRAQGATHVFVPDLMVVEQPAETDDSLRGKWNAMQAARQQAWQQIGPMVAELGRKDVELDTASRTGTPEQVAQLSRDVFQLRRTVEPFTETLTHAEKRLADLQAQWDKANELTGLTMLARLVRAEAIKAKNPRYLHAAVVSSGGHNRVSRNLFRMIFIGDGLTSMGGVVVRWALLESDGRLLTGDVDSARRAARFPSAFADLTAFDEFTQVR
jgi:hypothetical protein